MVFKILTGVIDSPVSCNFIYSHTVTKANKIVPIWNSLPEYVVSACSVEVFEKRLDLLWRNQECMYNYIATITGIRNRSVI